MEALALNRVVDKAGGQEMRETTENAAVYEAKTTSGLGTSANLICDAYRAVTCK